VLAVPRIRVAAPSIPGPAAASIGSMNQCPRRPGRHEAARGLKEMPPGASWAARAVRADTAEQKRRSRDERAPSPCLDQPSSPPVQAWAGMLAPGPPGPPGLLGSGWVQADRAAAAAGLLRPAARRQRLYAGLSLLLGIPASFSSRSPSPSASDVAQLRRHAGRAAAADGGPWWAPGRWARSTAAWPAGWLGCMVEPPPPLRPQARRPPARSGPAEPIRSAGGPVPTWCSSCRSCWSPAGRGELTCCCTGALPDLSDLVGDRACHRRGDPGAALAGLVDAGPRWWSSRYNPWLCPSPWSRSARPCCGGPRWQRSAATPADAS